MCGGVFFQWIWWRWAAWRRCSGSRSCSRGSMWWMWWRWSTAWQLCTRGWRRRGPSWLTFHSVLTCVSTGCSTSMTGKAHWCFYLKPVCVLRAAENIFIQQQNMRIPLEFEFLELIHLNPILIRLLAIIWLIYRVDDIDQYNPCTSRKFKTVTALLTDLMAT